MKTLIIVRHAKSSWDNTHLADHDRPLLEVGKKRTRLIIAKLQDLNIQPDLIISSSAKRALETAQYLAKGLSYSKDKIKSSANYYTASATELMNEFYDMPESFNTVMLVGHNPTLTYLSNQFLSDPIENLPTSGAVILRFDTETWDQLPHIQAYEELIITPKDLKKGV